MDQEAGHGAGHSGGQVEEHSSELGGGHSDFVGVDSGGSGGGSDGEVTGGHGTAGHGLHGEPGLYGSKRRIPNVATCNL